MEIQKIYRETKEGNGQRWLMIDLEDEEKNLCGYTGTDRYTGDEPVRMAKQDGQKMCLIGEEIAMKRGYMTALKYLKINGVWEDHIHMVKINEALD